MDFYIAKATGGLLGQPKGNWQCVGAGLEDSKSNLQLC